jgi:hypothetical protein
MNIKAHEVATKLVTNKAREIDLHRSLSFGQNGGKTMIDEGRGAPEVSFTIENPTTKDVAIGFGVTGLSLFKTEADLLAALNADVLLNDGVIYTEGANDVTVESNTTGTTVFSFLKYAGFSPLRLVSASFESAKLSNGAPETSNFSQNVKSVWISPFEKPVEKKLNLRKFQSNKSTAVQFVDVDFVSEGFSPILSNEHHFVLLVKKDTRLTVTLKVGAQLSQAQAFFRKINAADAVLSPLRSEM